MRSVPAAGETWQQIVIFVALAFDRDRGARRQSGRTNIKRLMAYSSINNVGFMLIGLACGQRRQGLRRRCWCTLTIYVGNDGCAALSSVLHAARRATVEQVEDDCKRWRALSKTRPMPGRWRFAMVMFSACGHTAALRLSGAKYRGVSRRRCKRVLLSLAAIGIAASVIGAFYYIKAREGDVLRRGGRCGAPGASDPVAARTAVRFSRVIAILRSLGYLLTSVDASGVLATAERPPRALF